MLAYQCGFRLVETEAIAANAASRQEALEALVAEPHEHSRADHACDLALELLVVVLAQTALEQEREAHVLCLALDSHRAALGSGAGGAGFLHLGVARRVLAQ